MNTNKIKAKKLSFTIYSNNVKINDIFTNEDIEMNQFWQSIAFIIRFTTIIRCKYV